MVKVFRVEDESIIREGLRDSIPWEQYGYTFVGEAGDGEMALPLIRKTRPDVLITDIKMPFMDGLELSHIVTAELPSTKIIIISGHDDFEYARQAIEIGVEQYLLKPITRSSLQKVLIELKDKIETEREQSNYLKKFQSEYHEYEQLSKRHFFEKIFDRKLALKDVYDEAAKLGIELNAPCYNIALAYFKEGEEEVIRYFSRFNEYVLIKWNINVFCILIMADNDRIGSISDRCKQNLIRICEASSDGEWNISIGDPVERLSLLADCYEDVNRIFSYRFLIPDEHVITHELVESTKPAAGAKEKAVDEIADMQAKNVIKLALTYIEENFANEELSLNDVASVCNVSPNYFSSLFSNEMGQTFVEYVTGKRITKAKKLLKTTAMHTGDIAIAVGYKDQHYFSVVFKKIQGCSPRDYRNGREA